MNGHEERYLRLLQPDTEQWWTGDRWTEHMLEAMTYTAREASSERIRLREMFGIRVVLEGDDGDDSA